MIDDDRLSYIESLLSRSSQGLWNSGHLADNNHVCDCAYIFSEEYAGGIGTVYVNNGQSVANGGNDAPPIEEAKANLALIVELRNAAKDFIAIARAKNEYERLLRDIADQGFQSPENTGWRLDEITNQARAILADEDWKCYEKTPEQIEEFKRKVP